MDAAGAEAVGVVLAVRLVRVKVALADGEVLLQVITEAGGHAVVQVVQAVDASDVLGEVRVQVCGTGTVEGDTGRREGAQIAMAETCNGTGGADAGDE
jgi:hypothetical protein